MKRKKKKKGERERERRLPVHAKKQNILPIFALKVSSSHTEIAI